MEGSCGARAPQLPSPFLRLHHSGVEARPREDHFGNREVPGNGLPTGGPTRVEIYSPAAVVSVHLRTDITRGALL
jgi:hypothetical protein